MPPPLSAEEQTVFNRLRVMLDREEARWSSGRTTEAVLTRVETIADDMVDVVTKLDQHTEAFSKHALEMATFKGETEARLDLLEGSSDRSSRFDIDSLQRQLNEAMAKRDAYSLRVHEDRKWWKHTWVQIAMGVLGFLAATSFGTVLPGCLRLIGKALSP